MYCPYAEDRPDVALNEGDEEREAPCSTVGAVLTSRAEGRTRFPFPEALGTVASCNTFWHSSNLPRKSIPVIHVLCHHWSFLLLLAHPKCLRRPDPSSSPASSLFLLELGHSIESSASKVVMLRDCSCNHFEV